MLLRYALVETSLGWIGLLGSSFGLRRLTLPQNSPEESIVALGLSSEDVMDPLAFGDLSERLKHYCDGREISFPDQLDLAGVPPFHQVALSAARGIVYGDTRSYSWVACQVGNPRSARAVGQAMAKNPVPIVVPCHRVIASDGGLGGYGGGLEMKRHLLEMESRSG